MSGEVAVILGAGPIGRTLAEHLAKTGQAVRIVSRAGTDPGLRGVTAVAADLTDAATVARLVKDAGVVFHAAAPAYHRWVEEFPALQAAVLQGMAGSGATLAVVENLYGYGTTGRLTEDLPMAATTRKGRLRARLTQDLLAAHAAGRVRMVILRASDLIGPGVRTSVFGDRFWPRLIAGRGIGWFGNPDVLHSATYVPDFARAMIRLAGEPAAAGRAWHVPSPPARSPRDLAGAAAARLGLAPPRFSTVSPLAMRMAGLFTPPAREMVEMLYSYETDFVIDDGPVQRAFGLEPAPWNEIIDRTLAYWRGLAA